MSANPPRIGHLSTFYHTATLLMAEDVASKRLGMPLVWRIFGTGPAIVEALDQNELDLAYIGLPPAIIGISRGVGIKCIAGGHIEGTLITGHAGDVGYPKETTTADVLAQYRGHTIGVPGKGSIHDVILTYELRAGGLSDEVRVINFKWADLALEAFVKGEVAALVGTPALAIAAETYGDGKIVYPPHLLWPDNPSYGIVATQKMIAERPDFLGDFLGLHMAASALMRDKPEEAAARIAAFVGVVDEDFVLKTLGVSPRYCAQITKGYAGCTMEFVKALHNLGYIEKSPTSQEIFDTSIIDNVHEPGDHYW